MDKKFGSEKSFSLGYFCFDRSGQNEMKSPAAHNAGWGLKILRIDAQ
jgi:hypothetical protein